ncbi:MAG: nuclear transport factor 2 family protein [Deltaproteobacteria bacterium]|nr:nuclear transport factor 2 family protein [Deltaproteobacteria bacterium]
MNDELPDVLRRYLDAYNQKDVDAMLSTMTADVVFENISNSSEPRRTMGKAALEALARQSASVFSSRRQTVVDAIVSSSRIALMIEFEAVLTSDMSNGWKAGQTVRMIGASFFTLREGLIAKVVDFS